MASRELFERFARGRFFFDSIVAGDRTWAYHFTRETKRQSLEWRRSNTPKKRKFKQTQSARKTVPFFGTGKTFCLLNTTDNEDHKLIFSNKINIHEDFN